MIDLKILKDLPAWKWPEDAGETFIVHGEVEPERALDLLPTEGGRAERALQGREMRGSAHFLESGEVAIDGLDRVSVVAL